MMKIEDVKGKQAATLHELIKHAQWVVVNCIDWTDSLQSPALYLGSENFYTFICERFNL